MEVLSRSSVSNRQKLPQEELSIGRRSLDASSSVPNTPPPLLPARDKYFSPGEEVVPRSAKDMVEETTGGPPTFGTDTEEDNRMPPFVTEARSQSKPVLLDTYFTFHSPINGNTSGSLVSMCKRDVIITLYVDFGLFLSCSITLDDVIYTSDTVAGSNVSIVDRESLTMTHLCAK